MTETEFNIYIGEIRGRMLRFAFTILHNKADAEDVVSQVSERLWQKRARIEYNHSSTSFAMTAVRNGCYDLARYRKRWQHEEPNERLLPREAIEEQNDKVELVRVAMRLLPQRQREILHLKDIEGYSTHEIAELYELEESNIRVILSRARTSLREIIIKYMQR